MHAEDFGWPPKKSEKKLIAKEERNDVLVAFDFKAAAKAEVEAQEQLAFAAA